jgi:hypothetical protein
MGGASPAATESCELVHGRENGVLLRGARRSKIFGDGNIEGDGVRLNRAGEVSWL